MQKLHSIVDGNQCGRHEHAAMVDRTWTHLSLPHQSTERVPQTLAPCDGNLDNKKLTLPWQASMAA